MGRASSLVPGWHCAFVMVDVSHEEYTNIMCTFIEKYTYSYIKILIHKLFERRHFQINPASRSRIYWRSIAPWLRLQRVIGTAMDTLPSSTHASQSAISGVSFCEKSRCLFFSYWRWLARWGMMCPCDVWIGLQKLLVDITDAVETIGIWICLASAIFVQRFNFSTIWNINLLCFFWGSSSNYLGSLGSLSTCCLMVKLTNTFEIAWSNDTVVSKALQQLPTFPTTKHLSVLYCLLFTVFLFEDLKDIHTMKMHENDDNKGIMHVDAMLRCPVPFSYILKNLHTRHHL